MGRVLDIALSPLTLIDRDLGRIVGSIGLIAVGVVTGNTALIGLGVSRLTTKGGGGGKGLAVFDPKQINPEASAPRKLVFGRTAFPVDLRYAEPSGTEQEYIDYIFVLAAHKSDAIDTIYIEDDLAWTLAGGAQGKYDGYLTIEVILEAGPSAFHTVNGGAIWGASTRMTGCTTMKARVKRSDNSKTSQSPFASGIAGRWTIIGNGIPVYDPALDSTVPGGSGSQRVGDQTTWAYTAGSVARGDNPALQLLAYLLGWKINGIGSVGCGLLPDTLDMASFATAAALCDESVALLAGGSQRRYEAGIALSDDDDPQAVIATLLAAMNGELTDDGGRLALRVAVNDLTPAFTFTDDDFVSGFEWRPQPPVAEQYTVVRGRYSSAGPPSLYSMVDYQEVAIPRQSNAPRILQNELRAVQEPRRAERIAKQIAQRQLIQGTFTVTLGIRGWLLRRNMVAAIDSNARGWTNKLFRTRLLQVNMDGTVDVEFREESASIYAWDRNESPQVTPIAPVVFDTRKAASWLMAGIAPGADVTEDALTNDAAIIGSAAPITVGDLITAATAPPSLFGFSVVTSLGPSGFIEIRLEDSQSVSIAGFARVNTSTGTGALTMAIEARAGASGSYTSAATSSSASEPAPAQLEAAPSGTLTNSSGEAKTYQLRSNLSLSGSASGTVDSSVSFIQVG